MKGVTFGTSHSFSNLGMVLTGFTIGFPKVNTSSVYVFGRNGDIDLTEALSGSPVYGNRTLKFEFSIVGCEFDWEEKLSDVCSAINGKYMDIVMDDDTQNTYNGLVEITSVKRDKSVLEITVSCDCKPYKANAEGVKSL